MPMKKLLTLLFVFIISVFVITTFITPISIASSEIYVWSPTSEPLNSVQTSVNSVENNVPTNNEYTNSNTSSANSNSTMKGNTYKSENQETTITTNVDKSLLNSVPSSVGTDLNLECGGAVLIEQNSGRVLYDHNMHQKLRPASVTKIMSILLIMEAIDSGRLSYTDKIPCTETAAAMGGSQIWLDVREELTVDEMLKAICVVSANDCTVAMAEYLAGSQEAFVEQMNAKAKELGMNDTNFKNCHGIDEDGHETSAYDIALMSRELLTKHPDITKYTTIWMDSLRDGKSELVNTNKLIRNYKGATGLKTGSTSIALYNLSASATRDNLSLIAVIMKAPTTKIRFAEAEKLLDYGFSNFQYSKFSNENDILKSISVQKGVKDSIDLAYETSVGALVKKGESKNVEQTINIPEIISAPINKGDVIGNIVYTIDGNEVAKVNIIANESVEKNNIINMINYVFKKWSFLR
ncbi:d-alanyl-D-alanine carboxypeptidase [Clostridium sp. CAG:273]|nr:D-alanyl-D-alanine carboxypeptidase family protein [Clostridia bacterium]CDE84100.1 d-alanyl-D-alanine carboxypeptidase [Clostridium sp. CAG:273]